MTTDFLDVLRQHGIHLDHGTLGRHYTTCPRCSQTRKAAHQRCKVLGDTIENDIAHWGCNHCAWTGATGKMNGHVYGRDPNIYYDYVDENGELLFQKVRGPNKRFWQRKPDGADGWVKIGEPATCNPDGAAEPGKKPKWRREYSEMLRGADLVVIGDHDDAGCAHRDATATACTGFATEGARSRPGEALARVSERR
jgi:hypothetical protein